jgi:aldose 1-epimerase
MAASSMPSWTANAPDHDATASPMSAGITLRAGALRLAVRPDLGGAIAGLWHGDLPVLRSTEAAGLAGPRQSACFPLLPYSNRIGHRRFDWQGEPHQLAANFDDGPHALHGVGWLRPWQVLRQGEAHLTLGYTHAADAHWPYSFVAEQDFCLSPGLLSLALRLCSTDKRTQPAGLGWHPYFVKRPGSRLRVGVGSRWERDALELPAESTPQPGIDALVDTLDVDHCYAGWPGEACIEDDRLRLRLASTLPYLVIFTPPALPHFCVEPVSHVNNAVQHPVPTGRGIVALSPGQVLSAAMTLRVEMPT